MGTTSNRERDWAPKGSITEALIAERAKRPPLTREEARREEMMLHGIATGVVEVRTQEEADRFFGKGAVQIVESWAAVTRSEAGVFVPLNANHLSPDECANRLCIPRPNRQTPDGAAVGAMLDALSLASAGRRVRFKHGDRARTMTSASTLERWAEALGIDPSLITIDVPGEVDTFEATILVGAPHPPVDAWNRVKATARIALRHGAFCGYDDAQGRKVEIKRALSGEGWRVGYAGTFGSPFYATEDALTRFAALVVGENEPAVPAQHFLDACTTESPIKRQSSSTCIMPPDSLGVVEGAWLDVFAEQFYNFRRLRGETCDALRARLRAEQRRREALATKEDRDRGSVQWLRRRLAAAVGVRPEDVGVDMTEAGVVRVSAWQCGVTVPALAAACAALDGELPMGVRLEVGIASLAVSDTDRIAYNHAGSIADLRRLFVVLFSVAPDDIEIRKVDSDAVIKVGVKGWGGSVTDAALHNAARAGKLPCGVRFCGRMHSDDSKPVAGIREILTGHRSDAPQGIPIPTPAEHIDLLAAMAQRQPDPVDDTERARRFFAGEGEGRTSGANQWQGAANFWERGTR